MSSNKILALVIYLVILAFLTLNPWIHPDSSPISDFISWDKIDHSIAYCIMSLWLMSVYSFRSRQLAVALMAFLTSSLTGLFFEYLQLWFTSTREFSYLDVMANVFGAALGVMLYKCYLLYTRNAPRVLNKNGF